jgi:hypothetical protein
MLTFGCALVLLSAIASAVEVGKIRSEHSRRVSTEHALAQVRDQLHLANHDLGVAQAQLADATSKLNDREVTISAQGGQLQTFKDCLNAAKDVNTAYVNNDRAAFNDALDRTDKLCTEAGRLL